jgi:hypothetical protein
MRATTEKERERFASVVGAIVLWKGDLQERQIAAALTTALVLKREGIDYFAPSDVPEQFAPKPQDVDGGREKSQGVRGTAWHLMTKGGNPPLIEPCFVHAPERGIVYGQRTSRRRDRNGAKERLYKLTGDGSLAEAWLRGHGYVVPERKKHLELALP